MSSSKMNKKLLSTRQFDSNRSKNASMSKGSKIGSKNPAFASTRSNLVSSANRKNVPGAPSSERSANLRSTVQIFDEAGNDVTPIPLLNSDPAMIKKNQANVIGDNSVGTPTDLMSMASSSIYGTQAGTGTASMFAYGPFTRSVFTQSHDTGSDSIPLDEVGSPEVTAFSDVKHKRQEIQETPTEEDIVKIVDINLSETETFWIFDMPDTKVSVESEEAQTVKDRNEAYLELQKSRDGNDLYMERGMNTFNEPPKLKSVNTVKIEMNAVGVECTNWLMYDTYEALEKEKKAKVRKTSTGSEEEAAIEDDESKEEKEEEEGTISRPSSPQDEADGSSTEVKKESDTDVMDSKAPEPTADSRAGSANATGRESRNTMASSVLGSELQSTLDTTVELTDKEKISQEWDELVKSEKLREHLFLMERVINLNTYQTKQSLYRGFTPQAVKPRPDKLKKKEKTIGLRATLRKSYLSSIDVSNPDFMLSNRTQLLEEKTQISVKDMGPNLDRLWSYNAPLTKGRNVSCIAWNKSNKDLVAVGYGQFEFTNQKSGLVCCWCIKNPEYPERVFTSKQGVMALDFSTANANLLAVGYYDGGIAVYNVRKSLDEPVLDNFTTGGKHLAPVWQLKWIEKERGSGEERAEVLISISTDGRVTQWSIRKGFESYDVMKLKKMATRMGGRSREKKGEAFISRYAGGMCFDFHSFDNNIYLAGTEEGYVHKCSCSHNEQYLESYQGHTGPVYTIQWSPFVSDIFLTCSADWTIKLWHQEKTKPILSFHSSCKAVNDVCWSPWSSTVFACVNEGAVEVWDLARSTLDAVYTSLPPSGAKQTSVSFSHNSQCLLVGDSEGQVTVYELRCMADPPQNQDKALNDVIKASLASQLPSQGESSTDLTAPDGDDIKNDI